MADSSNIWEDVRELLERIKEQARSTPPQIPFEVTPPDAQILGMYWRCVSLFRSLLILLDNNYPEEALILARSLFEDSLRLMDLKDAGTDRETILVGYRAEMLERQESLFSRVAEELGLTQDASDVVEHVRRQKRELENYRKRKGIGKRKKFNSVKDAAIKRNRQEDLWTYLLSHAMVHGEDTAHLYRRRKVGTDAIAFFSHTSDPDILAETGAFAARSIAAAVYATAGMFGWAVSPELQELVEAMELRVNDS